MKRCPRCNTPVSFPTEEHWYTCHACQGLIRLHTIAPATRRVEEGRQTDNQIVPVQVSGVSRPTTSRPAGPSRAVSTHPIDSRSTSQRTTTASTSAVRRTVPPQTRASSANPGSMNIDQVRAEWQRISSDVQALDERNLSLLAELNQYAHNPDRISALSAEMARQSQRRSELMRRDEVLVAREAGFCLAGSTTLAPAAHDLRNDHFDFTIQHRTYEKYPTNPWGIVS